MAKLVRSSTTTLNDSGLNKVWNKHVATGLYRRIPSACQQTGRPERQFNIAQDYGAQFGTGIKISLFTSRS